MPGTLTPNPSPEGGGERSPLPLGEGPGVRERPVKVKLPLSPKLLAAARALRQNATNAEVLLWELLRNRQLGGVKFRRQHPIGKYVVDFYAHEEKLAIEVDGKGHAEQMQARYDSDRTLALETEGIRVLRFWNHGVLTDPEAVLQRIWQTVNATQPEVPHP